MSDSNLLNDCPIWKTECLKEKCTGYEVHTKQRFKNRNTGRYIPLDQLYIYADLPQERLDETIDREVRVVMECRKLGKIIAIEEFIDHRIPSE